MENHRTADRGGDPKRLIEGQRRGGGRVRGLTVPQRGNSCSEALLHQLATAPGLIVVATDFRWVNAFPVLRDDTSDLNRMYRENAERILLQSVAAATMSAHLAAASLGYCVWWITAIGQEAAQEAMKPLLGIPDELSVLDIMAFGPPAKAPYKRWRRDLNDIVNWNRFDASHHMNDKDLDDWIRNRRHRVMFKDASKID